MFFPISDVGVCALQNADDEVRRHDYATQVDASVDIRVPETPPAEVCSAADGLLALTSVS